MLYEYVFCFYRLCKSRACRYIQVSMVYAFGQYEFNKMRLVMDVVVLVSCPERATPHVWYAHVTISHDKICALKELGVCAHDTICQILDRFARLLVL